MAIQIVDSMTAMRALPSSSYATDPNVELRGYYAVGDGGYGMFAWNASDTRADNLGTVIKPNDVSSGPGRLNRLVSGDLQLAFYGAKLDGVTDDIAAWKAFFDDVTLTGKVGKIGPGVSVHSENLVVPANRVIVGSGPKNTILKPTSAVTIAISQLSASILADIGIDGSNTDGAVGHDVGGYPIEVNPYRVNNGISRNIISENFAGEGGCGGRLQRADAWTYYDCLFWGGSKDGFRIGGYLPADEDARGAPTQCAFYNCFFKQNQRYGVYILSGGFIDFFGGCMQHNGEEGVYADASYCIPENPLERVIFHAVQFEQNQTSHADARPYFNVKLDGYGSPGEILGFGFRDCRFVTLDPPTYHKYPKALHIREVRDFVIDNPEYLNNIAGAIKLEGNGDGGTISNWPSASGNMSTVVDDQQVYGSNHYVYEAHGTFQPEVTFATPGTRSISYISQIGRWYRRGKTVRESIVIQTSSFTYSGSSGALRITGSPFTAISVPNLEVVGPFSAQGITKSGYTQFNLQRPGNTNYTQIVAAASGSSLANVLAVDVPSGGSLLFIGSIEYEIA